MASQEGRHGGTGSAEGDVRQFDARSLVEHGGSQIVCRRGGAAPHSDNAGGVLLGVIDEVLQGLKGTVLPDHQDIRGALEHIDLLEVQGLITGIAHFHGLDDGVGKVVTSDRVAVWLALDQFRPAEGSPASDLVGDDHILAEKLF